ncbi:Tn3 family transposase [Deinococcus marmoris]|uniref:Tn3 family transposase n=1 Tax=Deinococcus marmoris TaxID=249408 RepID=UPI0034C674AA
MEADQRAGISPHFGSFLTRKIINREDSQQRLLLCLSGIGTNTGLKQISAGQDGQAQHNLQDMCRYFIHRNTLYAANVAVVYAVLAAQDPDIWGDGPTNCASDAKWKYWLPERTPHRSSLDCSSFPGPGMTMFLQVRPSTRSVMPPTKASSSGSRENQRR